MRLSLAAVAALCAIPALALPEQASRVVAREVRGDAKSETHLPHPTRPVNVKKPSYTCKHPHCNHKQHNNHVKPQKANALTDAFVCERLNHFSDRLERIRDYVVPLKCGKDDHCWREIVKIIYGLEFEIDAFDKAIDQTDLEKCLTCQQESKVACCYKTYAESLIHLLDLIAEKSVHLEGETDKYVVTAINSLKAADCTFVHELGRRLQCDEYLKDIIEKSGAADGSTKGSIRQAFNNFVKTPHLRIDNIKEHKPEEKKAEHGHQHHHQPEGHHQGQHSHSHKEEHHHHHNDYHHHEHHHGCPHNNCPHKAHGGH